MHLCHGRTGTGEKGGGMGWGGAGEGGLRRWGLGWEEIAAHVCLRGAALMKNEQMRSLRKVPGRGRLG